MWTNGSVWKPWERKKDMNSFENMGEYILESLNLPQDDTDAVSVLVPIGRLIWVWFETVWYLSVQIYNLCYLACFRFRLRKLWQTLHPANPLADAQNCTYVNPNLKRLAFSLDGSCADLEKRINFLETFQNSLEGYVSCCSFPWHDNSILTLPNLICLC